MEYKDFAINLAKQAGEIMRQNFQLGMEKTWKADNTPVTETDLSINRLVIESVKKEYPSHNVLAEEESYQPNKSEYLWVCDPVDGTIPFSSGIPTFTFSLALVKNGESILGLIYDPILDRMFFAEKGTGTTLNFKTISVSTQPTGYIDLDTMRYPQLINPLRAHEFKLFKYGSGSYGGIMVACGSCVAVISKSNCPHDAAAVKIIVEEAGGKVTDLFGNDQRYDQPIKGFIASNGKVHDILVEEVGKTISSV